jgi:hypothetical protein
MKVIQAKAKAEIGGISDAKAAVEVFPNATPGSAAAMMSKELRKINEVASVRDLLADALEKYGISADSIVKVVAQGMKATKPTGEEIRKYDEEGNLKRVTRRKGADHSIRLKATSLAAKFMGIGETESPAGLGGIHFHQHIEGQKKRYDFTQ